MTTGTDISSLETRYMYSCQARGVPPNKQVLSALFKAKLKKARHEVSSLVILLDDIKDTDFHPLLDLLTEANLSEIDAVDIINRSVCILSWEYLLVLVRASSRKLRVVDLQDILFGKDFLLYVLPHLYILFPTLCHNQFMFCVAADATIF